MYYLIKLDLLLKNVLDLDMNMNVYVDSYVILSMILVWCENDL
jgi:hypothetical protein